jgi:hypothetical protein
LIDFVHREKASFLLRKLPMREFHPYDDEEYYRYDEMELKKLESDLICTLQIIIEPYMTGPNRLNTFF